MIIEEAFKIWKDKVLWINFPSCLHLSSLEEIEKMTRRIIESSLPDKRLIIGITEDIPEDKWQKTLPVISKVINALGEN